MDGRSGHFRAKVSPVLGWKTRSNRARERSPDGSTARTRCVWLLPVFVSVLDFAQVRHS